jgi:hypothetical protein
VSSAQPQTLFLAFQLQQKEYTLAVKTTAQLQDNLTTAIKPFAVINV